MSGCDEWKRVISHGFTKTDGLKGCSATRSKVYTARFRRAKRLQLERQVMVEILHGRRIHRRVRNGRIWRFSPGGENDRSCSWGNPNQMPETRKAGSEESDDGDPTNLWWSEDA